MWKDCNKGTGCGKTVIRVLDDCGNTVIRVLDDCGNTVIRVLDVEIL